MRNLVKVNPYCWSLPLPTSQGWHLCLDGGVEADGREARPGPHPQLWCWPFKLYRLPEQLGCCCACWCGWARLHGEMERFLGFVKQIRRSRRRKGKKYRPEEDYHEGYEDVYYYASEHFRSKDPLHPPACVLGLTETLVSCFSLKCKIFPRWYSLGVVCKYQGAVFLQICCKSSHDRIQLV